MPRRRTQPQLAFEAISIEGGLLSPEWLSKVAQLAAGHQTEADYRIPKGLNLRDEIGRYWRIAQAHWKDFALSLKASSAVGDEVTSLHSSAEVRASSRRHLPAQLAERFLLGLLRESFGFTTLAAVPPIVLAERNYPLGHAALGTRVPIVIAPAGSGLDTLSPAFGDGTRRRSPFGLVQEYLNAADGALWGLATDGLTLRVLRDNASLTRPAWMEADLARIFTEERYADFAALWLLLHETRFGRADQPAAECALESWREAGREQGTRAREHLRRGVEEALVALGQGFLTHPENQTLRAALQSGTLTTRDYFSQLLRLVYRLIFLLTVEERDLLHPPGTPEATRTLYARGYALRRLCAKAVKRGAHDRFSDLWESLGIVLRGLADGEPRLGLPALAGLFARHQCPALDAAKLENRALLLALFKLAWLREDGALARVNWRDMGSEELGSVYESLLELIPRITDQGRQFGFITAAGNERKTTGSYYTPSSLVECLLDSALDPVVDQRLAGKFGPAAEQAILSLKVCDPACGSGHFLIAAAHRLARRLAAVQAESEQPSMAQLRHALREVIGHCLYGVDVNPMSVELCKVTLWLEATEPGKPLSFLDHHIQCGNSLLGATPRVLRDGLPDDAFKPIEGDDKTICTEAKKRNKSERQQLALFHGTETAPWQHLGNLPAAMLALGTMSDDTAAALHAKEQRYAELVRSTGYLGSRFLADAWCAAFVWKKTRDLPYPITNDVLRKIERNPHDCAPWMRAEIERLRDRYQFFHWQLAFPEVFPVPGKGERPENEHAGWNGGFDVMLGNPPWERTAFEEVPFFITRSEEIANAPTTAARQKKIRELRDTNPALFAEYEAEHRKAECEDTFYTASGSFALSARGRTNTFALFADLMSQIVGMAGRVGVVIPTAIATDTPMKDFWNSLVVAKRISSLLDFENRGRFFPNVHGSYKFSLLTLGSAVSKATYGFFLDSLDDVRNPSSLLELTPEEIQKVNPDTGLLPVCRSRKDFELLLKLHDVGQSAGKRNPAWVAFTSAGSSEQWIGRDDVPPQLTTNLLPLYEAKLMHQFDHRFASFESDASGLRQQAAPDAVENQHLDASFFAKTRFLIPADDAVEFLSRKSEYRGALLVYRDLADNRALRTMIATILPFAGAIQPLNGISVTHAHEAALLVACLNSFVFDFATRMKTPGMHVNVTIFNQLPVLPPATYAEPCAWAGGAGETLRDWLLPRVLELTYTAWDLEPFARDCGWFGPPFVWDEARRFQLRCELDAAFLHLYGLSREDAAYILDTFPIVRRKDEAAHGTYRTKDTILALYDHLATCAGAQHAFVSPLKVAPASFRCTHAPRLPSEQRIALDSAPKFLLSFVHAFLRQTGEEATFDLLDSVFHLLRQRARHADEFAAALGDDAKPWLASFNDRLPNGDFLTFLKRLEADEWITADRHTGRLRFTEKFPAMPFDVWRNYDISAALRVITQRPEVVRLVLAQPDTPLASQAFSMQKAG